MTHDGPAISWVGRVRPAKAHVDPSWSPVGPEAGNRSKAGSTFFVVFHNTRKWLFIAKDGNVDE